MTSALSGGSPQRRDSSSVRWPLALALVVPILATTGATLTFILLEASGRAPLSHGAPLNIAEAAAMANSSEVLRRLRQGDDPDQVLAVRPELISSSVTRATALEAAVWAREGALMRLLIDSGAITNDQTRRHLACLALDISARDLAEDLSAIGDPECVAQQAYEQVLQRSRDHEAGQ